MASASPLFFLLITLSLCIPHSSSLSSQSQMLLLTLTHSLSQSQSQSQSNTTTAHHLLKTTTTRSFTRFRHHHHHHRRSRNHHNAQLSLPLSPGSDYTLSFTLSSHQITLYMDTGSDLVWFPCSPFTCILCDLNSNNTTPTTPSLPKISQNNTVPCHSPSCSAAHSRTSSSDLCTMAKCPLDQIETNDCSSFKCPPFYYAYGDGSLIATLYKHTISLSSSLHLNNFTFGCAHTTLNEPIGVAGFGRGLLSLPSQIATFAPQLGNRFSYCLVSHSFDSERVKRPSPLILGSYDDKQRNNNGIGDGDGEVDDEFVYTPMLENHKHPYFYSVGLVAISVGKRVIPAPEMLRRVDEKGNGGVVVDSGTTFTMLPAEFYNSVVVEFDRRVGRVRERASRVERNTGLKPCYYLDGGEKRKGVAAVTLHFGGGNYSSVALPRKNYFYEFMDGGDEGRRVGCLMLINGGDEAELSGGPGATLGNYQQQGFEVVYDLQNKRVGFARRQCASLWERLSRENN